MAWQIYEANHEESTIVLVGIHGNGSVIAERLSHILKEISEINIRLTDIKINKKEPFNSPIELSLNEEDYSGK